MYIYIDKCESLNSQQCNSSYFIHTKVYERVNDYLNLLKEKHNPTVELFSLSSVFLRFLAVILTFRCDCVCNRRILMTKNCLNVFAHLNRMGNKTQVACLYVIPMSLEMQFTQKLKVYQHPYVVLKLKCFCLCNESSWGPKHVVRDLNDFQCMKKTFSKYHLLCSSHTGFEGHEGEQTADFQFL